MRYGCPYKIIDFDTRALQIIKRAISNSNLKWEDGLKDYYKLASKRNLINTPSYSQVVKPIYKSSKYRWKKYQKFLLKFENKLTPWLKIFGYLNQFSKIKIIIFYKIIKFKKEYII